MAVVSVSPGSEAGVRAGWVDVAAGAVVPARLVPPPETSVAVMV